MSDHLLCVELHVVNKIQGQEGVSFGLKIVNLYTKIYEEFTNRVSYSRPIVIGEVSMGGD